MLDRQAALLVGIGPTRIAHDLNEALSLCDRIAVTYGGRIMADFDAADKDMVARIGELMAGISSAGSPGPGERDSPQRAGRE